MLHALVIVLGAAAITGAPRVGDRVFVAAAAPSQIPSRRAVQARRGEKVTLYAVVVRGRGGRARYYSAARRLRVGGRLVPRSRLLPLTRLGPLRFRWYQVEPRQHHVQTKPPRVNHGILSYANAALAGRHYGRWIGYDTLEYYETPVIGATGPRLIVDRATPQLASLRVNRGLGTMRYKVVVSRRGASPLASPGASATSTGGILPRVLRVSFRRADDLVGYLEGYLNVPNVFGSAGPGRRHQTERYQGADCADVIVGAARRAGAPARWLPYTHAAALFRYARPITPRLRLTSQGIFTLRGGRPVQLRRGAQIRRGDIVMIDYQGASRSARRWDHVGLLAEDRGVKGRFDPQDTLIHVGAYTLRRQPLASQGPAIIQILRFRRRLQRAFARHQRQLRGPSSRARQP